jgi:hypothetical protein
MNITVKITQPEPPASTNLYRILRDYERPPYTPRESVMQSGKGLPATQKSYDDLFIRTTEEYQFWWRDLLIAFAPLAYKSNCNRIFQRLTDGALAWCNKNGSDTNADFVNGNNLTKEAIKQETLMARGNVVNVIGAHEMKSGEWWMPVETLTIDHLPAISECVNKRWLIHSMTTITPEQLPDGTYRANPFWDFGGADVPLPIISKTGVAYLPEAQLAKVIGNVPSPYNPPK